MSTLITVLHVVVCVFLILVILLQAGKGGGGLGFGIQGSQTVFGGRGSQTFLGKVTSACAAIFFTTCIVLSFMASHGSVAAKAARGPDGGEASVDGGVPAAAMGGDASTAPTPAPEKTTVAPTPDGGIEVIPASPKEQAKP